MATRVLTIEYNNLQKQFHRITSKKNQNQMTSLLGADDNMYASSSLHKSISWSHFLSNKQLATDAEAPFWVEQIKRITNDLKDIENKSMSLHFLSIVSFTLFFIALLYTEDFFFSIFQSFFDPLFTRCYSRECLQGQTFRCLWWSDP